MKKVLVLTLFLLVSMAWAVAQTHDPAAQGQASSPNSSVNDSSQQTSPGQSTMPGQSSAPGMPPSSGRMPGDTQAAPPSDQSPVGNMTVTEGCLGGTAPNFTITDKAGMVYKLNIPAGTDTSVLTKHVGESVQVAGDVKGAGSSASASSSGTSSSSSGASIEAKKIGRGQGTCPGSATGTKTPTPPAK